jgi:integral membrane sensor signal transduction histidine kinase
MQEGKAQASLWADSPSFTVAAHELKAPLALIRQLAIELEAGEYTALERAVLAQRITLTAERALRLTTDLTKARRLENALFTLEAIDAAGLCNEVMSELQPLYRAHNKSLKTQVKSRQRLMVANRDLLRRIIANFADNALHYSADDSSVAISVRATDSNQRVRIGVRDFGPAIPARAWRALRQGLREPLPLHNRPGSSGLGMFIANEFALAIGAQIGVIRHRDGATFYVDVPASTQLRLL